MGERSSLSISIIIEGNDVRGKDSLKKTIVKVKQTPLAPKPSLYCDVAEA